MNRALLGILALVCLAAGIAMVATGQVGEIAGGLIKSGLVLGALWLALPAITGLLAKTPRWMLTLIVIGIVVCVVRPQLLLIVVPFLLVAWFLSGRFLTSWADPTILRRRQRRKRQDAAEEPGERGTS